MVLSICTGRKCLIAFGISIVLSTTRNTSRSALAFSATTTSRGTGRDGPIKKSIIRERAFSGTLLAGVASSTTASSGAETALGGMAVTIGPVLPPLASTAKRVFFVRHGEVINPGGDRPVYYGGQDVPLSPLGEQEACAAAEYLEQFPLDIVFSSPLRRAVFGAEAVRERQSSLRGDNVPIAVLEGLRELNRGSWCGKTKAEIGEDAMRLFDACDESVTPEGGESFPALKSRVLDAVDTALSRMQPGQQAALVSHLQVTRSILSHAMGIPVDEMVRLKVATASVTCIDFDGESSEQMVHFQSFKPDIGLAQSKDGAN